MQDAQLRVVFSVSSDRHGPASDEPGTVGAPVNTKQNMTIANHIVGARSIEVILLLLDKE